MDEDFIFLVLSIVQEIPKGKVASYKQIAILADRSSNARLVGKILKHSDIYGEFPCHRVVNSQGRLVPGWDNQRSLLKREGVTFKKNGNVDMKKHQWKIN